MAESHFHELKPSSVIIIATDLIAIFATFLIVAIAFNWFSPAYNIDYTSGTFLAHLIVVFIALQIMILSVGLYNEKLRETFSGITVRLLVSVVVAYILSSAVLGVTIIQEIPGHFTEYFFSSMFAVLVAIRFGASKTPYKQIGMRRILVLGAGKRASIIERCMRRKTDRVGMDFVGFVPMPGDSEEDGLQRETLVDMKVPLETYVIKNDINEIIIAADERRNVLPNERLFRCKRCGIKITDIIDFVERETGQIAVHHIYPSWIIYGNNNNSGSLQRTLDWTFNSAIAFCIFAVTWPFMLLTVLAIKLEEGINAPVLYSQKRTGLNGKIFEIYKFRSMRTDAEKNGAQWAAKSDPRVTRVGNFIRKYRIDELPQLYNVVKGDMGFVGPRPERPQFTEQFELSIPYYNHRLNVKPGLTGWAQLKYPYGSSHDDAVEKLKFDLYYIKNRGFMFDLLILLRTAEIILFGKGR